MIILTGISGGIGSLLLRRLLEIDDVLVFIIKIFQKR